MSKNGPLALIFNALVITFMLAPLVIVCVVAFTPANTLTIPTTEFSLRWFRAVFAHSDFVQSFKNSLWLAFLSATLATALAVPAGLAIARHSFPGRDFLNGLFLSPLIIPHLVLGVALLRTFSLIGATGSFFWLALAHVVIITPYALRLVLAAVAGTDRSAEQAALSLGASQATMFRRITLPGRTVTDVHHVVVGVEANAFGWDLASGLTYSKYALDESYTGGYMKNTEFRAMLANRTFDPFVPAGNQTAATQQLIQDSLFKGSIREASSTMKGFDVRGSRELFSLPGGKSSVGVGAEYRELQQVQTASTAAKDGTIYSFAAPAENDYTRDSTGVFGELNLPLMSNLEMSAAVRYDKYSAVKDALAKREVGESQDATTYKVTARYTPTTAVLLRASYGTGFRVADQDSIASPVVNAGVTAAARPCPATLLAENSAYCYAVNTQYPVKRGGNEKLKPEESEQFTIGFRIDASPNVTFGADLWDVKMTNQVSSVSESQAFTEVSAKFRELFTTYADPATGQVHWAFIRAPINIGKSHNRGIDWDVTISEKYSFGKLSTNINGTYMLKADYTLPGTDNQWENSMDKFGINDAVTFRNVMRITTALETGNMLNSLSLNYRNSYQDALTRPYDVALGTTATTAAAIRLTVPSYTTIDYQGKYTISKMWDIRGGVKNLMDREPPLSLRASSGHQVGYDPRYADTMGRTFYISSSYKFW